MRFIVGVDDFGKVIQKQLNFIDKSLFIKEILDHEGDEATVITRPRRFGKTLNLSMLQHFLASEVNLQPTKGMFDHLKIAQSGEAYMRHQGQYPVIFITFKSMSDGSFEHTCEQLRTLLQEVYREHKYLTESDKLDLDEKQAYKAIVNREVSNQSVLATALKELSRLLYVHHGIKPWLLIDEYDTPLSAAYSHNYYDQMIELMRQIFGSALKGNANIDRAVITGILRISKESLFSGVNNLKVYSILNSAYAEYFGFTESEVDEALKRADLEVSGAQIKAWYNGYSIGDEQIYNPWSIANCINEQGALITYWVHTSGYNLIKSSMASSGAMAKEKFEQILSGASITEMITEHMVFADLKTDSNALWSLLLFSGYLTVVGKKAEDTRFKCCLRTPNQEVAALYRDIIREWFNAPLGEEQYSVFLEYLTSGQLDKFLKILKAYLKESSSYFDTKGQHPEKFYHGFVLGLMVSLSGTHIVQSNKESGDGHYDVMIIPRDTRQLGLIIEFKVAEGRGTLKNAAEQALAQINRCDYEAELRQRNIHKILKVGLAFRGKQVEMASTQLI